MYIVQAGDNLWAISQRFGVALNDLSAANGITDPGNISVGNRLVIPGLEGVSGVLTTLEVPYGETLSSIANRNQIDADAIVRLNRIVSPYEIYAGMNLIIPQLDEEQTELPGIRWSLDYGETIFEQSVRTGQNYWSVLDEYQLESGWETIPGEVDFIAGVDAGPGGLPGQITRMEINGPIFYQGETAVMRIATSIDDMEITGRLLDHTFSFFKDTEGDLVGLQGIHAMTTPGLYDLGISIQMPEGEDYDYHQMVLVADGGYPFDNPLTVPPELMDTVVTEPEDAQWMSISSPVTPERYWSGRFYLPSSLPESYCLETGDCWTSSFGNRRSYNGSPYEFFHTGLDIAGKEGDDVLAPAGGIVVFTGLTEVRGNATVIDHGWGVYSGYVHQSEILVNPGDRVETGQLIGRVGSTGRSQGPHLHWEIIVNGVQVNPMDWLLQEYP